MILFLQVHIEQILKFISITGYNIYNVRGKIF